MKDFGEILEHCREVKPASYRFLNLQAWTFEKLHITSVAQNKMHTDPGSLSRARSRGDQGSPVNYNKHLASSQSFKTRASLIVLRTVMCRSFGISGAKGGCSNPGWMSPRLNK